MYNGLVAVVTGGGSGIGRALCANLAARGARVAVVDLDKATAEGVADAIGESARAYACDVADRSQLEALRRDVIRDFGHINLVFANAGVAIGAKVMDTDPREFQWLFDVNVGGVFHTMQAFVPHLLAVAKNGSTARFVVTGSENSIGLPHTAPTTAYTATKHAVLGLADGLRRDLANTGVGVTIFCPGIVATRVWDARRARQERYGGSSAMPPEYAARAEEAVKALGFSADLTATLALDGVERGEFLVVTDPRIREITTPRHQAVDTALDTCERGLAKLSSP